MNVDDAITAEINKLDKTYSPLKPFVQTKKGIAVRGGWIIKISGVEYIVSRSGTGGEDYVALVSLKNGNYWTEPVQVEHWYEVPHSKMSELTKNHKWKLVKRKRNKLPIDEKSPTPSKE